MVKRLFRQVAILFMIALSLSSVSAVQAEQKSAARPAPPAMSQDDMKAFLARPLIARLATVRANGSPQITPMWFIYEDGVMYMSTRTEAAKVKHLQKNPRAAVVVDEMVAPRKNKIVTIEGTVEVLTTGVKETTIKISQKYTGVDGSSSPQAQQSINAPRVILKITPQKIATMDTTH